MKPVLYFTHANGIPSASYRNYVAPVQCEFTVESIAMIGMNPQYPFIKDWRCLAAPALPDCQQRRPGVTGVSMGRSLAAIITPVAAYGGPELFSRLVVMST